jgi:hypothetical protein
MADKHLRQEDIGLIKTSETVDRGLIDISEREKTEA